MNTQLSTQEQWETIETVKLETLRWSDGSAVYVDKVLYDSMSDIRDSARTAGRQAREAFDRLDMKESALDVESSEVEESQRLLK